MAAFADPPADPSADPPTLAGLGTQLYDAVFHDDVRSVLIASQQEAATADKALRIRLRFNDDTAALATLPWEILFDPLHKQYLVLSEARPIVRYLALPRPKPPLVVQPPLRILAVLANARDHVPLDIEGEWQAVTAALGGLVADGKVVLERLESPTRRGLQERLMGDPVHVLHFVGHGAFDTGRGQGLLAFEDAGRRCRSRGGRGAGPAPAEPQLAAADLSERVRGRHRGVGQCLCRGGADARAPRHSRGAGHAG